ncbi:MAG TPA: P1 family peptidase [Casimicrobiaceae bacterium]|jgi:D-aminopeptidase|nr:P1 family peptidase [Casimicrobiaceae bacterium]
MNRLDVPRIGVLRSAARDTIADVGEVTVGHVTLANGAIQTGADFAQGAVGAGRGMSSFELKGGVGSASRIARSVDGHVVGALVLANFGRLRQLTIGGVAIARARDSSSSSQPDMGSVIVVLATDAALDARQLRRLAMRSAAGIARTGSNFGQGSGDIAIAFSTRTSEQLRDEALDPLFDAAAEATEQSIVHALFAVETVRGRDGHVRVAITERIPDWCARFRPASRT